MGKVSACLIGTALYIVVALVDVSTSVELSLTPFYLFIVLLVAWNCGVRWGIVFTTLSIGTQVCLGLIVGHPYSHILYFYLNAANQLFAYCLMLALTWQLRLMYDGERADARYDIVTGALTRRAFQERLADEIARQRRTKAPLSVAYIDCDDFKAINDKYGHSGGDDLLRSIASAAATVLRRTDIFGRLGGDEFGLILPDIDAAGASEAVQKLRRALAQSASTTGREVRCSIGLGTFHSASTPTAVLSQCDSLMYAAKSCGKNGCVHEVY